MVDKLYKHFSPIAPWSTLYLSSNSSGTRKTPGDARRKKARRTIPKSDNCNFHSKSIRSPNLRTELYSASLVHLFHTNVTASSCDKVWAVNLGSATVEYGKCCHLCRSCQAYQPGWQEILKRILITLHLKPSSDPFSQS